MRDLGEDAADAVLRACLPFRDQFIGVGLDSTEVGYPPSLFTEVYKLAAAEGPRLVDAWLAASTARAAAG